MLGVSTCGEVAAETHRDGTGGDLGKPGEDDEVGRAYGSGKAGGEGEWDGQAVGEADDEVADGLGGFEMGLGVGIGGVVHGCLVRCEFPSAGCQLDGKLGDRRLLPDVGVFTCIEGMRMRLGRLRAIVVAGVVCAGVMRAQEGGERPSFAGGQMVRGTVTAVAPEKLTVKAEDGTVYQVVTTTNTRVMMGRQPVKVEAVAVGSGVGAMGLLDAPTKTVHAMMVMVMDPEQVKKAREGMGKVYIAGKVTKIEETSLTIARTDGVTQVIEVDEGTSFKRGGAGIRAAMSGGVMQIPADAGGAGERRQGPPAESITLMEVKVGDTVVGQGGLKGAVFVPKELTVVPPGAGRRGRRPEGPDAGSGNLPPQ